MDEWGRLAIHLVAGGFHRLQPPHSFSLLHCRGAIFSVLIFTQCNPFIGTLKKKTRGTLPNSPCPQRVLQRSAPRCQGGGRALSRQTPPLTPRRGELVTPHHPPLPFPSRTPLSADVSPRALQPSRELASHRGDGGGKPRLPTAPLRRPQQRPSPHRATGTGAQRQEGRRARAPVAHRRARLQLPRPGLARAGCRGFCSRGPAPSPGRS